MTLSLQPLQSMFARRPRLGAGFLAAPTGGQAAPTPDTFVRFGSRKDNEQMAQYWQKNMTEGQKLFRQKRYEKAFNAFSQAREFSSTEGYTQNTQALHAMALARQRFQREAEITGAKPNQCYDEAEDLLKKALNIVETRMPATKKGRAKALASFQFDLGKLYYTTEQFGKAEDILTATQDLYKRYPRAKSQVLPLREWAELNQLLGYVYEQQGQHAKAIEPMETALAIQKRLKGSPLNLFRNLHMLGRFYLEALRQPPPHYISDKELPGFLAKMTQANRYIAEAIGLADQLEGTPNFKERRQELEDTLAVVHGELPFPNHTYKPHVRLKQPEVIEQD